MAGAPAAAARKPLPERLREKLREQNEARRQVYNPYTRWRRRRMNMMRKGA